METRLFGALALALTLAAPAAWAGEEYPQPLARPIVSSPSGNDHGTNSNYPLDPAHTVTISNRAPLAPINGGNGIVESLASLPGQGPAAATLAFMPRLRHGG